MLLALTTTITGKKKKDRDRDERNGDRDRDRKDRNEKSEEHMDDVSKNPNATNIKFVISARELPFINKKRVVTGLLGGSQSTNIPEPFVELLYYENSNSEKSRTYQTSTLSATANPEWLDQVKVKFIQGKRQRIRFTVFDKSDNKIAHASTSLQAISQAPNLKLELLLVGVAQKNGFQVVHAQVNNVVDDDTDERLTNNKLDKDKRPCNLNNRKQRRRKKKNQSESVEE